MLKTTAEYIQMGQFTMWGYRRLTATAGKLKQASFSFILLDNNLVPKNLQLQI